MKPDELKNILDEHRKWLAGDFGCLANLSYANLRGANLSYAELREADLIGARLPHFQVPDGDLIVYKKLNDHSIATLLIPSHAKRTGSLVGRKCRADMAIVLEGNGGTGGYRIGISYQTGQEVYPDKYDDDIRVECTHGIHFYLTKQEAENE